MNPFARTEAIRLKDARADLLIPVFRSLDTQHLVSQSSLGSAYAGHRPLRIRLYTCHLTEHPILTTIEMIMIGRLEEVLLSAIVGLGGESYSSDIHQFIEEHLGRDLSPGSLLTTLYRMEEKGFVSSRYSDPIPQRGGKRRRMFKIEGTGQQILKEAEMLSNLRHQKLISGVL